jgi:hypothetical protein
MDIFRGEFKIQQKLSCSSALYQNVLFLLKRQLLFRVRWHPGMIIVIYVTNAMLDQQLPTNLTYPS